MGNLKALDNKKNKGFYCFMMKVIISLVLYKFFEGVLQKKRREKIVCVKANFTLLYGEISINKNKP